MLNDDIFTLIMSANESMLKADLGIEDSYEAYAMECALESACYEDESYGWNYAMENDAGATDASKQSFGDKMKAAGKWLWEGLKKVLHTIINIITFIPKWIAKKIKEWSEKIKAKKQSKSEDSNASNYRNLMSNYVSTYMNMGTKILDLLLNVNGVYSRTSSMYFNQLANPHGVNMDEKDATDIRADFHELCSKFIDSCNDAICQLKDMQDDLMQKTGESFDDLISYGYLMNFNLGLSSFNKRLQKACESIKSSCEHNIRYIDQLAESDNHAKNLPEEEKPKRSVVYKAFSDNSKEFLVVTQKFQVFVTASVNQQAINN